jgi:hypothetical protein
METAPEYINITKLADALRVVQHELGRFHPHTAAEGVAINIAKAATTSGLHRPEIAFSNLLAVVQAATLLDIQLEAALVLYIETSTALN